MLRRLALFVGSLLGAPSAALAAIPGAPALAPTPETIFSFAAVSSISALAFGGLALASMTRSPAAAIVAEMAARLTLAMPRWPVSRISNDALGMVFRAADDVAMRKVAASIVEALRAPVSVAGASIDMDVTVGLAELGDGEAAPRSIIEHALIAAAQAAAD